MGKNVVKTMRKENTRLGNLDPDSQRGKGCCDDQLGGAGGKQTFLYGGSSIPLVQYTPEPNETVNIVSGGLSSSTRFEIGGSGVEIEQNSEYIGLRVFANEQSNETIVLPIPLIPLTANAGDVVVDTVSEPGNSIIELVSNPFFPFVNWRIAVLNDPILTGGADFPILYSLSVDFPLNQGGGTFTEPVVNNGQPGFAVEVNSDNAGKTHIDVALSNITLFPVSAGANAYGIAIFDLQDVTGQFLGVAFENIVVVSDGAVTTGDNMEIGVGFTQSSGASATLPLATDENIISAQNVLVGGSVSVVETSTYSQVTGVGVQTIYLNFASLWSGNDTITITGNITLVFQEL